jgi:hypothetical protein
VVFDSYQYMGVRGALTIGPNVVVRGTGIINYFGNTVTNFGTVHADGGPLPFVLEDGSPTSAAFVNKGVIEAGPGAVLQINGGYDNTSGTIRANGGSISIGGGRTPQIGTLQSLNGGTILIGGSLENSGSTLTATPTTGTLYLGGVINGGTLASSGGAEFAVGRNAWLNDVALMGQLSIRPPDTVSGSLIYAHNLTLSGGTISLYGIPHPGYGPNANLWTQGTETIGGTGRISFEGLGNENVVRPVTGSLTLGPGVTVSTGV